VSGSTVAYLWSFISMIIRFNRTLPSEEFFETSALLIMFVFMGRYLEAHAKGRMSAALTTLAGLQAHDAIVAEINENGDILSQRECSVDALATGMIVLVKPGMKIPGRWHHRIRAVQRGRGDGDGGEHAGAAGGRR